MTLGARRLVGGVAQGIGGAVRGLKGGAKEVAAAALTPVGILRGVERAGHSPAEGLSKGASMALQGVLHVALLSA